MHEIEMDVQYIVTYTSKHIAVTKGLRVGTLPSHLPNISYVW